MVLALKIIVSILSIFLPIENAYAVRYEDLSEEEKQILKEHEIEMVGEVFRSYKVRARREREEEAQMLEDQENQKNGIFKCEGCKTLNEIDTSHQIQICKFCRRVQ